MINKSLRLCLWLMVLLFSASACKKNVVETVVYDNIIYEIDTLALYSSSLDKDRLKTPAQFISTLYAHLYFHPIPAGTLRDLTVIRLATGDKGMVGELILEDFLNDPAVIAGLWDDAAMRADPDAFIEETYLRFFLRHPTTYELFGLRQMIEGDTQMSALDVYRGLILSNEYLFY